MRMTLILEKSLLAKWIFVYDLISLAWIAIINLLAFF
jgi:hypothetical protein